MAHLRGKNHVTTEYHPIAERSSGAEATSDQSRVFKETPMGFLTNEGEEGGRGWGLLVSSPNSLTGRTIASFVYETPGDHSKRTNLENWKENEGVRAQWHQKGRMGGRRKEEIEGEWNKKRIVW